MTTWAKGRQSQFLFAEESTFKTAPSGAYLRLRGASDGAVGARELLANPTLRGNTNPSEPLEGLKSADGPLTLHLYPDEIGWILKWALGSVTSTASGTVGAVSFTGSGLNDATSGGSYTNTDFSRYNVKIDAAGTPDTFEWTKYTIDALGNETAGATTSGVAITGAAQTLGDGIQVTFAATTGHTLNDQWDITGYGQNHHVFKLADPTDSISHEIGLTDTADYGLYSGTKINSVAWTFSPRSGIYTMDVDLMGAKYVFATSSDSSSITSYTSRPYVGCDMIGLEEGGALYTYNREITLTLDNGLVDEYHNTSTPCERDVIELGDRTVTGTMTNNFVDQTLTTKAKNGTETSLRWAIANSTNWLQFYMPELKYELAFPTVDGPDLLDEALPYQAYYNDSTEATALQVTLFNDVASY